MNVLAQDIFPDDMALTAPQLRRLYEDWKARRQGGIPRRADFDPASLSYILGSFSLIEVWRNPLRFRFRVHGTALANHLGYEFTGKFFDEVPENRYFRMATAHFTDVVIHARPSFAWLVNENGEVPVWENEALVLPLSQDGSRVDYLLSAVIHHRQFSLCDITHPYHRLVPLPN